jgi:hypothetical protein
MKRLLWLPAAAALVALGWGAAMLAGQPSPDITSAGESQSLPEQREETASQQGAEQILESFARLGEEIAAVEESEEEEPPTQPEEEPDSSDQFGQIAKVTGQLERRTEAVEQGMTQLEKAVDWEEYLATVEEKGLDVTALEEDNQETIEAINELLTQAEGKSALLERLGVGSEVIALGEQLVNLLERNSANISAMEAWLDSAAAQGDRLEEQCAELGEEYAELDRLMGEIKEKLTEEDTASEGENTGNHSHF